MKCLYSSIRIYFLGNIGLIASILFIQHILYYFIFEVQTVKNSSGVIEVVSEKIQKKRRIISIIISFVLLVFLAWFIIPVIINTPKIIADKSIDIQGEVLSEYKIIIAVFWILCLLWLEIWSIKNVLYALSKRLKIVKDKKEIYIGGYEHVFCLMPLSFIGCYIIGAILLCLEDGYSNTVQSFWNVFIWVEYVLFIISGVFLHQKVILFDNSLVVYKKYFVEGITKKENLHVITDETEIVKLQIDSNVFKLHCTNYSKEELKNIEK